MHDESGSKVIMHASSTRFRSKMASCTSLIEPVRAAVCYMHSFNRYFAPIRYVIQLTKQPKATEPILRAETKRNILGDGEREKGISVWAERVKKGGEGGRFISRVKEWQVRKRLAKGYFTSPFLRAPVQRHSFEYCAYPCKIKGFPIGHAFLKRKRVRRGK